MRDYRDEYDKFQSSKKEKQNRAKRNKVRRKFIREGKVSKGDSTNIHHVNGIGNDQVTVMSESKNKGMPNEGGRKKGTKKRKYVKGGRPGLWANIHAKKKRIASGSGEKMRKPGSPGAPTAKALRESKAKEGAVVYNKPKRTPDHATKSHVVTVKTSTGGKKTIRFGQQGKTGDKTMTKRAKSFKARHGKNIAKGPTSAAYWANKVKW